MKRALISPNEINPYGQRVSQVENVGNDFEVAEPLYWMDCDDEVVADRFYFDPEDNTIKRFPGVVLSQETSENDILNQLLAQLR